MLFNLGKLKRVREKLDLSGGISGTYWKFRHYTEGGLCKVKSLRAFASVLRDRGAVPTSCSFVFRSDLRVRFLFMKSIVLRGIAKHVSGYFSAHDLLAI